MKYLGIDYGSKRVGLALSDSGESFALPHKVITDFTDFKEVAGEVEKVCKAQKIVEIVVGESKDYKGEENQIMKDVKLFVEELRKRLNIPVHLHPEFLTSLEAEQIQGKNNMTD